MLSQQYKRRKILPLRMYLLRNVLENISYQNTPLQFLCCTHHYLLFPENVSRFPVFIFTAWWWNHPCWNHWQMWISSIGHLKKKTYTCNGQKLPLHITGWSLTNFHFGENKVGKTAGTHCQFI